MIRLLKYDLKRNAVALLGALTVLVLAMVCIEIFNRSAEQRLVSRLVAYTVAFVLIFVQAIKTYAKNIKSYSRRLLPVNLVNHVLSPAVMAVMNLLILGLLFLLHNWILTAFHLNPMLKTANLNVAATGFVGLIILWATSVQLMIIFTSITLAMSFRVKARVWIGIVALFALQYVFSLLGDLIPNSITHLSGEFLSYKNTTYGYSIDITTGDVALSLINFVVELIFTVALITLTVQLLKRRVEI